METQFFRYQTYSRRPAKGRGKRSGEAARSAKDILREAGREHGYCPHVSSPRQPRTVYGAGLEAVSQRIAAATQGAVDSRGRRLRVDALVMVAAVCSWPIPTDEMRATEAGRAAYRAWRERAIRFAVGVWGDDLVTVVEHLDEVYPHLHLYAVAPQRPDHTLRIADVDPAVQAAETVLAEGGTRREAAEVHRDIKRNLQKRFHAEVSVASGHARTGPRRKRYSRRGWLYVRDRVALAQRREQDRAALMARSAADDLSEIGYPPNSVEEVRARFRIANLLGRNRLAFPECLAEVDETDREWQEIGGEPHEGRADEGELVFDGHAWRNTFTTDDVEDGRSADTCTFQAYGTSGMRL